MGPVRAAQIVATAGTPHRFRTKRQFWSYSGLAVVTHTSAEYELRAGRVVRRNKPVATRGLNPNCNRRLKSVFISAATAGGVSHPWQPYLDNLARKGHARGYGAAHIGAENRGPGSGDLEERRSVRS